MKKFILLILLLSAFISFSQERKLMRKAAIAVDRGDYNKAIKYYDEALRKDSNSFYANAGKGIVLSEYMSRFEEAIPYLEKALPKSPEKNRFKINYDLGQSYHHVGNYDRALYYYGKTQSMNREDHPDYDAYLSKRIADCRYALAHPEVAPESLQWVKNLGKPINSEFPDYSPVYVNGQMIFTSQRKDSRQERVNGVSGRFFESMYICTQEGKCFSEPRRYTMPDDGKRSKFLKHNEAILSASADGEKLYIYRNANIYEAKIKEPRSKPEKMNDAINFSLQSQACLSPDGKTFFFASESDEKGIGNFDIYVSHKNEDGSWTAPDLMPFNTGFNEDSPFMSSDGTLYFASNGLPGYGGYDIYKTRLENGEWTKPENLGQPINTSADEMNFTLQPNTSFGYYSSARKGGFGDMDIYQVHYVSERIPECQPLPEALLTLATDTNSGSQMRYQVSMKLPERYAASELNMYTWTINKEIISQNSVNNFEHTFGSPGTYTVAVKAIVFCDSCPGRAALCTETLVTVGENLLARANKEEYRKLESATDESEIEARKKQKEEIKLNTGWHSAVSDEELKNLGWHGEALRFDLNGAELSAEVKNELNHNIEILRANKNLKIMVNGFADARGNEAYNRHLSLKRANAVKAYLIKCGIDEKRIGVRGLGESVLANDCSDEVICTEEQHAENRRVELKLHYRFEMPVTVK